DLGARDRLRRELQHGRKLSLRETCEQHRMAIRKFHRVVMRAGGLFVDLPEDRCCILYTTPRPAEEAAGCDGDSARKSNLSSRQKANRHLQAFWRREAARSSSEVMRHQRVTDGSGAGLHVL